MSLHDFVEAARAGWLRQGWDPRGRYPSRLLAIDPGVSPGVAAMVQYPGGVEYPGGRVLSTEEANELRALPATRRVARPCYYCGKLTDQRICHGTDGLGVPNCGGHKR